MAARSQTDSPRACIRGGYEGLYDQAGIIVRLDAARWIKAGIELSDGEAPLGSVLADGRSDWAAGPWRGEPSTQPVPAAN